MWICSKCALRVCCSGRCHLSKGLIRLWRSEEAVGWGGGFPLSEEVLVQRAAIFSCTISGSIIVPWITSIAGDNRQAAERTGWYRTPTPVWEAVWIISCLPRRLSMGAGDQWWLGGGMCLGGGGVGGGGGLGVGGGGSGGGGGGGCQCYDSVQVGRAEHKANPRLLLWVTAATLYCTLEFFWCFIPRRHHSFISGFFLMNQIWSNVF